MFKRNYPLILILQSQLKFCIRPCFFLYFFKVLEGAKVKIDTLYKTSSKDSVTSERLQVSEAGAYKF